MNQEELSAALHQKMEGELKEYKSNLLKQSPEEILSHASEYAVRVDILMASENIDLAPELLSALLESPSPLADVLDQYSNMETNYADTLRSCIEAQANEVIMLRQEATRAIPLYQQTGEYAREHGELDAFRASRKANNACRDAIERTIWEGFDGMHLNADPKGVLAEFGPERVSYVLAATLQSSAWDERFSSANQMWAATVPMVEPEDRRSSYHICNHPTVLDGFVSMVRKELAAAKEQPEQAAGKSSIKEQLAAKPVPGVAPAARQQERDVR